MHDDALKQIKLYPPIEPYHQGYLRVSDLHQIYYCETGNPKGVPVVINHGGPGGGSVQRRARFFDPDYYRIIMYDQRGVVRSKPFLCIEDNHTDALVDDIHKLKKHLNISQWIVLGGSWGSTLSLAYAQKYTSDVKGLVLFGVTLANIQSMFQIRQLRTFQFPEAYQQFIQFFPPEEQGNLFENWAKRLMSPDKNIHLPAAKAYIKFNLEASLFYPDQKLIEEKMKEDDRVLSKARIFYHYFKNKFFLSENQLLNHMSVLKDLEVFIVQGRYDCICPPKDAYLVHQALPKSRFSVITEANHMDIGVMGQALVLVFEKFKMLG